MTSSSLIEDPRPPERDAREARLLQLLQRVWTFAITTKSDYSREYADEIAEAASRGFVTTAVVPGRDLFGRLWKITPAGCSFLYEQADRIADQEVVNYAEAYCAD